jgi:hypothetical protein
VKAASSYSTLLLVYQAQTVASKANCQASCQRVATSQSRTVAAITMVSACVAGLAPYHSG